MSSNSNMDGKKPTGSESIVCFTACDGDCETVTDTLSHPCQYFLIHALQRYKIFHSKKNQTSYEIFVLENIALQENFPRGGFFHIKLLAVRTAFLHKRGQIRATGAASNDSYTKLLLIRSMENYKVLSALGQGTWGVVHKAEQKLSGRVVAIKKIKSERPEEGVNFTAVREIKLLREFRHENIVELVDCFTTPDQAVCLVYECAFTDLEKILGNKSISISLADTKQHLLSLLRAISACHDRWILHRDLKPDNMLFLEDGTMKLADFGLARMYGTPKTRLSPQAITLWYKPPELLLGASEYSSSADMWSVGCIFAELLLRRPFLQGQTDLSQLDTIFTVFGTPNETNWADFQTLPLCTRGLEWDETTAIPFDEIFTAAPKDAISLLRSILVLDPNMRFTATQCLSHPYFSNDPVPTLKEKLVLTA